MRKAGRTFCALVPLLFACTAAAAQLSGDSLPARQAAPLRASPPLPPDHWALDVLRRWEALDLLPESYLPSTRSVSEEAAAGALRAASAQALLASPSHAASARGALELFEEEFPATARTPGSDRRPWVGIGVGHDGVTSSSEAPLVPAPRLDPRDEQTDFLFGRLVVFPSDRLALSVTPTVDRNGARPGLAEWRVTAAIDPVELSIGRDPVGYGYGEGGSIVFSGVRPLDRVQVQSTRAVRLPGVLRHVGPVGYHAFFTRLVEDRHRGEPFLWGANATFRPHPRVTLGVNRGVIFSSGDPPVTTASLARMLVGKTNDGFDNQIVTVSFRFRLPTEGVTPLTVYGEWGAEDGTGAYWDSPGVMLGALLPGLFTAAGPVLGVEGVYLGNVCRDCRRVADPVHWYSHFAHTGGWVAEGEPMGHPLGGNGEELRVFARSAFAGERLHLAVDLFGRRRFPTSLYAPRWSGRSRGVEARADWRFTRRAGARLAWVTEQGSNWRTAALRGSLFRRF